MLANITVSMIRVNVYWVFWKPYIDQTVGGKWDVKNVFDRTEKHDPIQ
jgi:hypothetical protein